MQVVEQEAATADEVSVGGRRLGTGAGAAGPGAWILRSRHLHLGTAALNVVWAEPAEVVEAKGGLVLGAGDVLQYVVVSPGWGTGFGREAEFGGAISPGVTVGYEASASADVVRD